MKTNKNTSEIMEKILQNEDITKSLKDNMVQYCISAEGMSEEEAEQVVSEIIRGTADFTNSLKEINGKTKAQIANSLIWRLDEKLKGLPEEKADQILHNLFIELSALSIDQMQQIASGMGDDELEDMVTQIRENASATLNGKTYSEKLGLIADAVQNCGSLNALLTLAEDQKSFDSATSLDDAIATASVNNAEDEYVMDEISSLRIKNYTALAEYISARHGTNPRYDSNTPAYNIGVSVAADVEKKKIRSAALAGMITFDNAARLIGTIVGVALSLLLILYVTCFLAGLWAGITGITLSTGLMAAGAVLLLEGTGGWDGLKERGKKIGNVLATPIIWLKNLFVKLLREFCRIFNIPFLQNKEEQALAEEEIVVSNESTQDEGVKSDEEKDFAYNRVLQTE